jgi:RNA-binding protein
MALSNKQKQHLKGLAHSLKPVILLGQHGLTEGVMAEIEVAIAHHELIKIKVASEDRDQKALVMDTIVKEANAEKVLSIGHTLVIYRTSDEKKIILPKK